jgi:hypothetical protein
VAGELPAKRKGRLDHVGAQNLLGFQSFGGRSPSQVGLILRVYKKGAPSAARSFKPLNYSPAHDRALPDGNVLTVYGGHRGRPGTLGSGDRALRSCRASSAGGAVCPRRCGDDLSLPVVGSVVAWLSRGRAQRRRRRAEERARDRSSPHAGSRSRSPVESSLTL